MSGKGSTPRPFGVDQDTFASNWERTFGAGQAEMQAKTIHADVGETRKVTNEWAAQAEQRGSTVLSSTWEVTDSLALGATALTGTTATALITVNGCGTVTNTVTLSNGEMLEAWREVGV